MAISLVKRMHAVCLEASGGNDTVPTAFVARFTQKTLRALRTESRAPSPTGNQPNNAQGDADFVADLVSFLMSCCRDHEVQSFANARLAERVSANSRYGTRCHRPRRALLVSCCYYVSTHRQADPLTMQVVSICTGHGRDEHRRQHVDLTPDSQSGLGARGPDQATM